MRTITWLLVFFIAILIAVVLVLTFMQPAFSQKVGARIFTIKTPEFPVYLYVLGAFMAGLLFGVFSMLPGEIRTRMEGVKKNRRIRELEQKLVESENAHLTPPEAEKFLPPEDEEPPP